VSDDPAQRRDGWDTGLTLEDCAGWPVDEWFVTKDDPRPLTRGNAPIQAAALGALFRMQTWTLERPELARTLFASGLAYRVGDKATYLYSLFKTEDGQMRAFVRPGGPAYNAGLRTNDIIEKLDGKYWWLYGTYQTQARAYDGKPHVFLVERGTDELTLHLGAPFRP
jgi:predicted metalloprotease with PDZ domain